MGAANIWAYCNRAQTDRERDGSEGSRTDIVGLELWVGRFGFRAGEMAQWLRALAAFPENRRSTQATRQCLVAGGTTN